jgi:predicted permease
MDALLQDLRFTLRSLRKSPSFALVAILTIGLATGAATTAFTWLERMVLRPLPSVPEVERLVKMEEIQPDGRSQSLSYPTFSDWREHATAFEGIAVEELAELSLRTTGPARRVWGGLASANLFQILHVRPQLGRTFLPDEEARTAPVAVLSHGLWQRAFGADSGIVGRHVTLGGLDFTIVGVAPPGFAGSEGLLAYDLWIPVTFLPVMTGSQRPLDRNWHQFEPLARLKPGVSLAQARHDIRAVHRGLVSAGAADSGTSVQLMRTVDSGAAQFLAPVLRALLGIALVVVLIACANLANLLLARATTRQREIGIRLAVGAGRARLVRQLLTESLLLALCGGALGVPLAVWARDGFLAFLPAIPFPLAVDLSLDGRVLAFAAGTSLLTSVAFGLVPALHAARVELLPALRAGAATGPRRRSRLQAALVGAQVALSLVALVCAGLFVRSVGRAHGTDTGMHDPRGVLLVNTDLRLAGYTGATGPAVLERLLADVRALPGVRGASVATHVPLGLGGWTGDSLVVESSAERALIRYNRVAPDYFETVGIGILRGRAIKVQDGPADVPAVVVTETFARRYWPDADPLGRRIKIGGTTRTVIGVARDTRYRELTREVPPLAYVPIRQSYAAAFMLHVRAGADTRTLEAALRRTFERIDPSLPFTDVRTMAKQADASLMLQNIGAGALSAFGALALVIAAIGLYGVLSYMVSQRTREIGVRVAIGASRRDVIALVVGGAARLTAVGLACGLLLAIGAGQLLRSQLFGVSPLDPATFAGVIALLAAVALLAAWLPARRAARVDPIVALQVE